jgi:glutamate dehydrogenase
MADVDPRPAGRDESTGRERALAAFADGYIRRIPDFQLAGQPDDEVFAELGSVFDFVADREPGEVAVRVYDPDPGVHGYHLATTVVDVAVDDSPFLVDSVRAAIERSGHEITLDAHTVVSLVRDDSGGVVDLGRVGEGKARESVQHYVLGARLDAEAQEELAARIVAVLGDVARAVRDFDAMNDAVERMIGFARSGRARYDAGEIEEAVAFLEWLTDLHFVFLGYREYSFIDVEGERCLAVVPGSGLGILSDTSLSRFAEPVPVSELPESLTERYATGFLLVVSKTNNRSTVHRPARMDYIGVRIIGSDGQVVGEARLLGLFTSKALMADPSSIPILRGKLAKVLDREDLVEGSHDYRAVVRVFNSMPKAELWSMPVDALRTTVEGLVSSEQSDQVRLFVAPDLLNRAVTVMVVLPRDKFNAALRKQLQAMVLDRFGGEAIDYHLSLEEETGARIHFTVWVGTGQVPDVPLDELQRAVVELARTWEERIRHVLAPMTDAAAELVRRWSPRLPDYYKNSTHLEIAAGDILQLDAFESAGEALAVGIQNEEGAHALTRIGVYARGDKLELSQILPVLEALGLRVVEEVPTRLDGPEGEVFIHDLGVLDAAGDRLDIGACGTRVLDAIGAGLRGDIHPDSLDRLVVLTDLSHQQVGILRAYRTYRQRVTSRFTSGYVNDTLAAHPHIAERLVRLFEARFDPEATSEAMSAIEATLVDDLDAVTSLDEDRILRGFLDLIMATVRTNAFRPDRASLSLKLRSAAVPDMPEPVPLYEIFVFAPHVEGVHLRGGPVARGGIRWSDRREDYRAEVLGLMKAQMTKNAVIVPVGAKGGFVLRAPPSVGDAGETVADAYRTFIRGLLDVTDNLMAGEVVPPPGVRRHDTDDAYLVVAADRGTATFSDTANEIAADYGFWLEDAFASGGSAGYDHMALGITARGAWESVRRHFLDMSVDVDTEPVSVVGIGDMSGDVFGNGMLNSRRLRLVAAFDHRDIFLDPDPDPYLSFEERRRLFALPRSTWQDYDRELISSGGGVWSRMAKSIALSDPVRIALGTDAESATPDELIRMILCAPVDLLWNGGIGTYVKASGETHAECHDRANDAVRVDAAALRCRVVAEGGNLGLSQAGRIEFAMAGGRINTDFIDNSGGVDCSDREVNLKILLRVAEERGLLTRGDRLALIAGATEEVTSRVLKGNRDQALILSQDEAWSQSNLEAFEDLMKTLERHGLLDRRLEGLPSTDELWERAKNAQGLTRPELAVLLAYSKRDLVAALLASTVLEGSDMGPNLLAYFPDSVTERFSDLVASHPLRREILATVLANRVINDQGITFVNRLVMETGAERAHVVPAYLLAQHLVGAHERWQAVEDLGAVVDPDVRRRLLDGIDALVESVARWFLRRQEELPDPGELQVARALFGDLETRLASPSVASRSAERMAEIEELIGAGVPAGLAQRHVHHDDLVHAPDIIELAIGYDRDVESVAELFMLIGERYRLDWLESQVAQVSAGTRWDRWAIRSVEDDLVRLRRDLAGWVLETTEVTDPVEALAAYAASRPERHARLEQFMQLLAQEGSSDLDPLMVAERQIRILAR